MQQPALSQIPSKKSAQRRKHWPLILFVHLPNIDDPIKVETNTSLKVKGLKELIKEKAHNVLKDIVADRLLLTLDGVGLLKKTSAILEDVGIKDNSHISIAISDKPQPSERGGPREKRPEAKVPIIYTVRSLNDLNPENSQREEGDEMIQTAP